MGRHSELNVCRWGGDRFVSVEVKFGFVVFDPAGGEVEALWAWGSSASENESV